jgi:pimeloyl-ACP methyl ester carboxylesterase
MQVDPEIFTPLVAGQWLDGFDHEALWSRVKCPVLLLQGDPAAGGAFANEDVAIALEKCPHAEHKFFPGVGHQIHRTRPAKVIAAVNDFAT